MPPSNTELAASSFDEFTHADGDSSRSKSRSASGIGEKICYPQNELSGGVTFSRRIARYLSKYKWYYPQRDNPDVDLDTSWDYFEHVTLPRRFCDEQGVNNGGYEKAPKGEMERPTALYPINAPQDELADFGIGVGMYFATIKALVVMCIIAGAINIPVMMHFASEDYSKDQEDMAWMGRISGVCAENSFVPCPNCSYGEWSLNKGSYREESGDDGVAHIFVLKNFCRLDLHEKGWYALATNIAFVIFFFAIGKYQHKIEVRYDENEQTSTDYSIRVTNPPPFLFDPKEYKKYFEDVTETHVTAVTIALNNRNLLNALIRRRVLLNKLQQIRAILSDTRSHSDSKSHSDDDSIATGSFQVYDKTPQVTMNVNKIATLKEKKVLASLSRLEKTLPELYNKQYKASAVYVTFEQEYGQRIALLEFSVSIFESIGIIKVDHKPTDGVVPLFYGSKLYCEEPPEPDSVRWIDLGMNQVAKTAMKFVTLMATCGIVAITAAVIEALKDKEFSDKVGYSAILISSSNLIVPEVCKLLNKQETHDTDGSSQIGLYFKITLVRWVNTALLIFILTPHTQTLSNHDQGMLVRVISLLWVELMFAPFVRTIDLWGTFRKHVLAPRCKSQADMNLQFQGTFYFLAERYTDTTKVFFLVLFYAALIPGGYFMCAIILLVHYFNDKFCITRVWKSAPLLGTELTKFSRKYFFSAAFYALCLMTPYWWAGFPFDQVCPCPNGSTDHGCGETYPEGLQYNLLPEILSNISSETKYYYECQQDYIRKGTFPPVPSMFPNFSWMTTEQKNMTELFGWVSVAVMSYVSWSMFGKDFLYAITHMSDSGYDPFDSKNQNIDFSCVEICGYVPQVTDEKFEYPLLACNISLIDHKLIPWSKPSEGYEHWNIINDVPRPNFDAPVIAKDCRESSDEEQHPVFSIIEHYPPDWRARELEEEREF